MTTEEKRRELFEAWVSTSAWLGLGDSPARDGEGYAECETHTAWLAFNAALDAVALPARMPEVRSWGHDMGGNYEEGLADGYNNALDDISLTGLGLKVLP